MHTQTDEKENQPGDITHLLNAWSDGDRKALDKLFPLVFDDLRVLAAAHFRGESGGHTLQTTAVLNEAYIQFAKSRNVSFDDRRQFFLYASQVIRHILSRHARDRLAQKRGGGHQKLSLDEKIALAEGKELELDRFLALDQALNRLRDISTRQCRIIELRFFAGFTNEEVASTLNLSTITVKREWRSAKCWIYSQIDDSIEVE